jgi:hypothetical protein
VLGKKFQGRSVSLAALESAFLWTGDSLAYPRNIFLGWVWSYLPLAPANILRKTEAGLQRTQQMPFTGPN